MHKRADSDANRERRPTGQWGGHGKKKSAQNTQPIAVMHLLHSFVIRRSLSFSASFFFVRPKDKRNVLSKQNGAFGCVAKENVWRGNSSGKSARRWPYNAQRRVLCLLVGVGIDTEVFCSLVLHVSPISTHKFMNLAVGQTAARKCTCSHYKNMTWRPITQSLPLICHQTHEYVENINNACFHCDRKHLSVASKFRTKKNWIDCSSAVCSPFHVLFSHYFRHLIAKQQTALHWNTHTPDNDDRLICIIAIDLYTKRDVCWWNCYGSVVDSALFRPGCSRVVANSLSAHSARHCPTRRPISCGAIQRQIAFRAQATAFLEVSCDEWNRIKTSMETGNNNNSCGSAGIASNGAAKNTLKPVYSPAYWLHIKLIDSADSMKYCN